MITFTSWPSPVDNVKAVPLLSTYAMKKKIIQYCVTPIVQVDECVPVVFSQVIRNNSLRTATDLQSTSYLLK